MQGNGKKLKFLKFLVTITINTSHVVILIVETYVV